MSELPDIEVARYALRTFRIDYTNRVLMPVVARVSGPSGDWHDGSCVAGCKPPSEFVAYDQPHESPSDKCACGIYGCLDIGRLIFQYPLHCQHIIAVIAAEGQTIIGDIGLRTQAARVVAYWTPERGVQKICADTCGDATYFESLDEMLAAYKFAANDHPLARIVRGEPASASALGNPLTRAIASLRDLLYVIGGLI